MKPITFPGRGTQEQIVDYERGSDTDLGQEPSASETPPEDTQTAESSNEIETPSGGLGSDADVMNDASSTNAAPPEWPAEDLNTSADDAIAATYAAASDETDDELGDADVSDDSDAPILEDAAVAAATAVAAHVRAESVNVTQTGVQSIEASSVNLNQGGAAQVRAESMSVEQGGVGLARVGNLTLGSGASAFAVVADEATVEEGSNAFLVVSRTFNGDVQPTVDWRPALAFGAGLGLILSIFRRRR